MDDPLANNAAEGGASRGRAVARGTAAPATRHRVRAVLVGLPLVALGAFVLGAVLGPLGLIGACIVTVVGAVVIARDPPRALEHPGCLVATLSLAAWGLAIVVVGGIGWFMHHMTIGSAWCGIDARVFAGAPVCVGRDRSFLQGRHNFSEGTGPANGEACRSTLARASANGTARAAAPTPQQPDGGLLPTTCPSGFAEPGWSCAQAEALSGGNDMRRTLYGFSADCARAKVWQSTNVEWSSMAGELAKLR